MNGADVEVQGVVEVFGLRRPEAKQLAERGGGALRVEGAGGGELGVGSERARDEERHGAVALRAARGREQALDAELAERSEHGGYVAVGAAARDGEGRVARHENVRHGGSVIDCADGSVTLPAAGYDYGVQTGKSPPVGPPPTTPRP